MAKPITICFLITLLSAAMPLNAGIPVSIVASAPEIQTQIQTKVQWVKEAAHWADQINRLNQQIQQAKQIYQQAQTIAAFVSDPKVALSSIGELEAIAGTLDAIAGDGTSLGDLLGAGTDLFAAGSALADTVSEFDSEGKPRDVSLYEALGATAGLAHNTRTLIRDSIGRDDARLRSIDRGVQKVVGNPNAGANDFSAAQLRLMREMAGMQAQYYRQQQVLWMQEEERREREAKARAATIAAATDERAKLSKEYSARMEAERANRNTVIAELAKAPEETPPSNTNVRVWIGASDGGYWSTASTGK